MVTTANPRERGWRLAPAWTRPGRFWLAWPAAIGDREADVAAREDCLGLAELLSDYAPVSLICAARDSAELALRTPPNVAAYAIEHDGTPLGRHAPLWLADGDGRPAAAVAFTHLGRELAERAGLPVLEPPPGLPPILDSDGEGSVIATVAPADKAAAAQVLCEWLGVECPVLLEPLADGALSPAARFLAPGVVVLSPHPGNHQNLEAVVDARGRRLSLLELPNSKRGDGCYADCLVAGAAVVVPDFEDGRGTDTFAQVAAAASGRRVSACPAGWLVRGKAGLGTVVAVQPA